MRSDHTTPHHIRSHHTTPHHTTLLYIHTCGVLSAHDLQPISPSTYWTQCVFDSPDCTIEDHNSTWSVNTCTLTQSFTDARRKSKLTFIELGFPGFSVKYDTLEIDFLGHTLQSLPPDLLCAQTHQNQCLLLPPLMTLKPQATCNLFALAKPSSVLSAVA